MCGCPLLFSPPSLRYEDIEGGGTCETGVLSLQKTSVDLTVFTAMQP